MSCCGSRRSQFQQARAHNNLAVDPRTGRLPGTAPRLKVVFEHLREVRAVVIGPVSGNRYLFDGAGARVEVDPRDRRGLAALTELRQV